MNLYKKLAEGGGYSLPYLLHIASEDGAKNLYLINDNTDLTYNGNTYKASNFSYTPNADGDSSLEIELVNSDEIIDILESGYSFNAELVGIVNDDEIQEFATNKHKYGQATWDGKSLSLTMNKDDRLDMTFPALIFNSYNNRGNT